MNKWHSTALQDMDKFSSWLPVIFYIYCLHRPPASATWQGKSRLECKTSQAVWHHVMCCNSLH